MKYLSVLVSFFLLFSSVYSQEGKGRNSGEKGPKPSGSIIGKVLDSQNNEGLEYANITVRKSTDSSLVTGVISSRNGEFLIEKVPPGKYYVLVNFIGYNEKFIPNISISPTHIFVDLGKIELDIKSEILKTFEVTAEKEGIEFKIDKKVVNVEKFYTATSGTAVDILENVPSVSVDAERNVTLRGSAGFTVLIDGRPTVMDAADALEQYPSTSIESIEIITNPSAKYDPEGTAGIINIITKKQKMQGISGIANLNIGMYDNYGADALVQVKTDKTNWYVGVDYNRRGGVGTQETYNATRQGETVSIVGGAGDYDRHRTNATARAGIDLKLSNKNFWLIEGSLQSSNRLRTNNLDYQETLNENVVDNYNSLNESSRESFSWNVNTDYAHKFMGEDRKFTFQFSYGKINGDEYTLNELFDFDDNALTYGQKTTEVGPNHKGQTRLNYEHKINDSLKYEVGFQGTYDASSDEFTTSTYDTTSNAYLQIDSINRSSSFYRFISAPYAVFTGSKKKFGYQFGLRGEFTNRNVSVVNNPKDYTINRIDVFPTAHFSYEFPKKAQLMASYTRRIERPRPWYLEPYITARDQWNYRGGNPGLKPEYIDAAEIGFQKRFGKMFVSSEVYYRYTHDKVERVRQAYPEKGPGVTLQVPENVGQDQSLGLELMVKTPITTWWDISFMTNVYDYRVTGSYTDVFDGRVYDFDNASTNYTLRLNQNFSLFTHTKLQFNSSYNSPTVTAQGKSYGFFNFTSAIRTEILPNKLIFNLSARNLFGTMFHKSESFGPNFESRSLFEMAGPVVQFTAIFKLNNYREKKKVSTEMED